MQMGYGLNLSTMEHHLVCAGIGARFNAAGNYISSSASILSNMQPVDCISILQQGNLCEVALLINEVFSKRVLSIDAARQLVQSFPVQTKAVFTIRRKVGEVKCIQTLYLYPFNRLSPYVK